MEPNQNYPNQQPNLANAPQVFSATPPPRPARSHKKAIIGGVVALLIVLGIVATIVIARSGTDTSTSGTSSPAAQQLQQCMQDKGISSDNWEAYQKAAMDCQASLR